METNDLRDLLNQIRTGQLTVDAALQQLTAPVADLGYAHVDLHRRERCGFPEVIFCEGKPPDWVDGVVRKLVGAPDRTAWPRASATSRRPTWRSSSRRPNRTAWPERSGCRPGRPGAARAARSSSSRPAPAICRWPRKPWSPPAPWAPTWT